MGLSQFPSNILRLTGVLAVALVVAACNTNDTPPNAGITEPGTTHTGTLGQKAKSGYTAQDFVKTGYCPPIEIRSGTEVMSVRERGTEEEPGEVRYQASITKTARECRTDGGTLAIKVGVAGRVVAGPKGSAGTVTLPLRIAVAKQFGKGSGPLFSQLYKIPVTLSPPSFGSDFAQTYSDVTVSVSPEDRDLIVYVGFDEGKKPNSVAAVD